MTPDEDVEMAQMINLVSNEVAKIIEDMKVYRAVIEQVSAYALELKVAANTAQNYLDSNQLSQDARQRLETKIAVYRDASARLGEILVKNLKVEP